MRGAAMRYRARSMAPKLMNNFRATRKSELSADPARMRETLIKNTLRSRTNSQSGCALPPKPPTPPPPESPIGDRSLAWLVWVNPPGCTLGCSLFAADPKPISLKIGRLLLKILPQCDLLCTRQNGSQRTSPRRFGSYLLGGASQRAR